MSMIQAATGLVITAGLGLGALVTLAKYVDKNVDGLAYSDFGLSFGLIGVLLAVSIVAILLISLGRGKS